MPCGRPAWWSRPSPPARPCRWPRPVRRGWSAGAFFLDFNSASPGAKIRAAEVVECRRRALRRRRGDDLDPALPHQGAAAAGRARCRGAGAAAGGAGFCAARGERSAGRGQRHQDVPQRDDQGPGGDGHRELHHGAALRRRGRGDRLAASRPFPASTGRSRRATSSSASSSTAAAAARKCARWPRPCARPASRPGVPPAPPSARPGWRTWPTPGLFGARGSAGLCTQRRLAHRGRPHPGERGRRRLRTKADMNSRRPPAGWTGAPNPSQPRFTRAAGQRRRALPCLRPRRTLSLCRGAQVHALRRVARAAVRAARPPRLRAQRGRAGHLPRRRQPRHGRRAQAFRRPGARHGHRQAHRHRPRTARHARVRRARRALQFRQSPGGLHAARRAAGDRRAHRAAGLARGDLFRGRGPARAVGLLHRPADHRGGRPHGPPRREQAGGRARVRALRAPDARARAISGARSAAPSG